MCKGEVDDVPSNIVRHSDALRRMHPMINGSMAAECNLFAHTHTHSKQFAEIITDSFGWNVSRNPRVRTDNCARVSLHMGIAYDCDFPCTIAVRWTALSACERKQELGAD